MVVKSLMLLLLEMESGSAVEILVYLENLLLNTSCGVIKWISLQLKVYLAIGTIVTATNGSIRILLIRLSFTGFEECVQGFVRC